MKHIELSIDWIKLLVIDILAWTLGCEKWGALRADSNRVFSRICKTYQISFRLPEFFWFWSLIVMLMIMTTYCLVQIIIDFLTL